MYNNITYVIIIIYNYYYSKEYTFIRILIFIANYSCKFYNILYQRNRNVMF